MKNNQLKDISIEKELLEGRRQLLYKNYYYL